MAVVIKAAQSLLNPLVVDEVILLGSKDGARSESGPRDVPDGIDDGSNLPF